MKSLSTELSTDDYRIGQRVQAHPATDTWMRGDRYGTVVAIGRKYVHVEMDVSRRVKYFAPDHLMPVDTFGANWHMHRANQWRTT